MVFIAHRGNTHGANPESENRPDYIVEAINKGFDCEIDIWYLDGQLYLGHDKPKFKIEKSFLEDYNDKLWIHAKDLSSLVHLSNCGLFNVFSNDKDDFALTSKRFIWTNYQKPTCYKSILMINGQDYDIKNSNCYGVCSDFVGDLREKYLKK